MKRRTRKGRPPIPDAQKRVALSVTLDPALFAMLAGLAESERMPVTRVIERLIFEALKQRGVTT